MSAECDSVSQGVPAIDIKEFLECPVCKCFVASPIYSCPNGHVVCGICKPKIIKCPTCKVDNLAVNGLVERILKNKGVEAICRNDEEGCARRIKVWEMKKHLDDFCDFRLIKCTELYPEKCEDKYYAPKDLLQHWISFHKAIKVQVFVSKDSALHAQSPVALNMLGSVTEFFDLNKNEYDESINYENSCTHWPVMYFKLDSQTFVVHAESVEEMFHVWITLLGDESDATKYKYTCTISSNLCTSQPKREVKFRGILVHSLQYYDFKKASESGYTAAIRVQSLKMLQDEEPIDPDHILEWNVRCALSKV